MEKLQRPRGKDQVVAAIIAAGGTLFAEHPYRDVSVRMIAETADINQGLIHRHIGSKRAVLKRVLEGYQTHFRTINMSAPSVMEGLTTGFSDPKVRDFLNTMAFLILSGETIDELATPEGGLIALLSLGRATSTASDGLNLLAIMAMLMGWMLFEPFLLSASGGIYDRKSLEQRIFVIAERLAGPSGLNCQPSQ